MHLGTKGEFFSHFFPSPCATFFDAGPLPSLAAPPPWLWGGKSVENFSHFSVAGSLCNPGVRETLLQSWQAAPDHSARTSLVDATRFRLVLERRRLGRGGGAGGAALTRVRGGSTRRDSDSC